MGKGFAVSTTAAVIFGVVVVCLFIAEGLLIGLLGRPTCDAVDPGPITDKPTDKPATSTAGPITSSPLTTNAPELWKDERLPTSLKPTNYQLSLRPDFDIFLAPDTNIFYGSSSVTYMCNNATDYLILHSVDLNYTDAFTITTESGEGFPIAEFFFYGPNAYLVIRTASMCEEGVMYTFHAPAFCGPLGTDLYGLYRSTYVNESGDTRIIAVTQMETRGSRHAFPCFDEPSMKATFDTTLYHRSDQGYFGITNMPAVSNRTEVIDGNTWDATVFNTTLVMPTYLLAFVVCDFDFNQTFTRDGVQTRIYARPASIKNKEATYAADITPRYLDYFGDYYDIPYSFPKSDQIGVNDFGAGAMENWGLVIYRHEYLLYEEGVSSITSKYFITYIIAHELAHQWFGNLVSCAWWNEIWLNEGFATYVSFIGMEHIQPTWKNDEMFILEELQGALTVDSYSTSHPLVHPEGYFSTITYSKGASVIRMFNEILGETTFTNGLKSYLNEFSYGNAVHDDLFKHWIDEAEKNGLTFDADLLLILESWTLQMGYPLLTVSRGAGAKDYVVSQKYFLVDPEDTPVSTPGSETYNYEWYVYFGYQEKTTAAFDTAYKWLLPGTDLTFEADSEFIIGNHDAKGFYRVKYDRGILDNILEMLEGPQFADISPQNRAQLIDDAFNLVRANEVHVSYALDTTRFLIQDTDYIPWETFTDEMVYFDYMLSASPLYGDFKKFVVDLVEPSIYEHFGWDDSNKSDSEFIARMTRAEAIDAACYYGSQNCTSEALVLFESWKLNPNVSLNTLYRTDVYCTAIKEGTVEDWDFMWNVLPSITDIDYQRSLRYALSCSKELWIINRYLDYCFNDEVRVPKSELSRTLSYIAGHEHGKYPAFSYLYDNWDDVTAGGSTSAANNIINAAVRRFSTDFDIALLESLKLVANSASWTSTLNSYISDVQTNILWRSQHEADIGAWLGSSVKVFPPTPKKRMYKRNRLPDFDFAFKKDLLTMKPY